MDMKVLGGLCLILLVLHVFGFAYFTLLKFRRLRKLIKGFFDAGVISNEEHESLKLRYESSIRILSTLPDPSEYPNLYGNHDFIQFSDKWMSQRKYFSGAILILFIFIFSIVPS